MPSLMTNVCFLSWDKSVVRSSSRSGLSSTHRARRFTITLRSSEASTTICPSLATPSNVSLYFRKLSSSSSALRISSIVFCGGGLYVKASSSSPKVSSAGDGGSPDIVFWVGY
uniref:Uncharacterized protein n=1 Tax=Cacopsylla melanoneura TaxID=428564 RepID=A0A8D8W5U3_9HEMI